MFEAFVEAFLKHFGVECLGGSERGLNAFGLIGGVTQDDAGVTMGKGASVPLVTLMTMVTQEFPSLLNGGS